MGSGAGHSAPGGTIMAGCSAMSPRVPQLHSWVGAAVPELADPTAGSQRWVLPCCPTTPALTLAVGTLAGGHGLPDVPFHTPHTATPHLAGATRFIPPNRAWVQQSLGMSGCAPGQGTGKGESTQVCPPRHLLSSLSSVKRTGARAAPPALACATLLLAFLPSAVSQAAPSPTHRH